MAETKIITNDGIVVVVHGTPEEVSTVVKRLRPRTKQKVNEDRKRKILRKEAVSNNNNGDKVFVPHLIDILRKEGFFKTPRGLSEIRKQLSDMGHYCRVTVLSGVMQTQIRKNYLRRFKQSGIYVYLK